MNPIYNLAIRLMGLGINAGACRNDKLKKLADGEKSALSYLRSNIRPGESYVWIHAASLGEFEQGRPLIERIRREHPEKKILLTFFSPSGYEVRKNFPQVDLVSYLPFDLKNRVKEFLDIVNPCMAIFVKYEFWGNYLSELKRRSISTYIISAIFRPSQIFFKPWGGMFRKMLQCYTHIYVQDERSKQLLAGIGIDKVTVAGDTRFDRVTDIMASCKKIPEIEKFIEKDKLTLVAGSTWQPDEAHIIPYFNSHPEMKLIIAPHEVDETRVSEITSQLKRPYVRMSKTTPEEAAKADCIIIDCFGILSSAYTYGDIAYIGGGFGVGIHNLNEAAVYGIPVIFGPNHKKFKEASDLISNGGGTSFSDNTEFNNIMDRFINDEKALKTAGKAAGDYIKSNIGASDIIFNNLFGA
ncbi:glycosyltransferase N-terminal domain-containing protein [uncultured Muribaculum sp.]|uniref:3-deoxy-D-manno-octulosonic acid transferase n=1 Tax=uncultured Muribaculum sp. TaxID=1918613 RepID=UPI0025964181|nr:glycosyltransferase N-terminal domain-containing protein [uncultured Muribaculum sp.]